MKLVLKIFILCVTFTLFVKCFACDYDCTSIADNSTVISRSKRHLDFMKGSRMFFRANIKETVFTWGVIWAHASGWKANMNFLNQNKALRPYYRRDTVEALKSLLDLHGIDGEACMLKAFCTSTRSADGEMANGMLFKLLRYVFTLNENDRNHFSYLKDENCDQIMHHHCPLSFNNISPYTDDI